MTILDKTRIDESSNKGDSTNKATTAKDDSNVSSGKENTSPEKENSTTDGSIDVLREVESQFKTMMSEFQANAGFSVDTGEQPVDTMVEILSSSGVNVSIVLLLSYIRYCINHKLKKDITVKVGYNKPAAIPMNFAVNEELLEEIFPGDVVEVN